MPHEAFDQIFTNEMVQTSKYTFIGCARVVGYMSSSSCFIAAVPRNKSNWVPCGNNPEKYKRKTYASAMGVKLPNANKV